MCGNDRLGDNGAMDNTTPTSLPTDPVAPGPTPTYLERQGTRQYVARNERGAEVLIGDGPQRFSPGDLLKLALAACNAMSSDHRLEFKLGEDFRQVIGVSGEYDGDADRYDSFEVELIQDLSSLSDDERQKLMRRAEAAIDRSCTIGHTITRGVTYTRSFRSEPTEQ